MDEYFWLVIVCVFILIVAIMFGLGWYLRSKSHPNPAASVPYSAPEVWGPESPGPNNEKNFCQAYTFPTSVVSISGVDTVIPGAPSLNSQILDGLNGVSKFPLCLDTDQGLAQQVQRTCIVPPNVDIPNVQPICHTISGGTTGVGGIETYYTNSGCLSIPICPGQLSLVSINYQIPYSSPFCIQNNGAGNVTMEQCDPSNQNQLFRVTRVNPGQNPNNLVAGQGQNGVFAQILDRNSGLCLIEGTGTTTSIFVDSYGPPCQGSSQIITGNNVVMGSCSGGTAPYEGYYWALVPSITYCPKTTGCNPSEIETTPPQISFIEGLDFSTFPTGNTEYLGFTGPSAQVAWFRENNVTSLYYGGSGNGLITVPFATSSATNQNNCVNKGFAAQYINLGLYNTISKQRACYATDISFADCFAL